MIMTAPEEILTLMLQLEKHARRLRQETDNLPKNVYG
jgi:hypothetical protein